MRTIKFRGFDAISGKGWVYGDLVHNQKVTRTGLEPRIMVGGYEVIAETVGQYTGLNDKNGKEIYEGDLVRYGERNYVVSYEDSHKGAFSLIRNNTFVGCFGTPYPFEPFYVEVVGNIHDNPELIKK